MKGHMVKVNGLPVGTVTDIKYDVVGRHDEVFADPIDATGPVVAAFGPCALEQSWWVFRMDYHSLDPNVIDAEYRVVEDEPKKLTAGEGEKP